MNEKPLILLIEDTVSHAELVIKILTNLGYGIHWENSGKSAIEYCKTHQPDLFLIDIALSDAKGEDVMKILRKILPKHFPMIAITAHSMDGTKEELLDLGFDDYLSKPFTIDELKEKIQWHLPNAIEEKQ